MMKNFKDITVAVAGTGYVGLSIATLLSQHHHVTAVDVIPEKVEKLNNKISPIQDDYIRKVLLYRRSLGKEIRLYECKNCVVHAADESKVVVQGLDGYIVAEKNGQLLVCSLKEEQRIKEFGK
jgi:UDP-glucose 6-dehydrogenase